MDDASLREYARRARKEGRSLSWIAEATGTDQERLWLVLYGRPRSAGAVIEWPDSMIKEIVRATCSEPVPDAVWTSATEFHCPICNEAGSVARIPKGMDNPVIYTAPRGHPDRGGGNFTCPFAGENRSWKVSRFQDRPGTVIAESDAVPGSLTWLQYHDRLVQEWFDGERALVDDLYPEPDKPAPRLRNKKPYNKVYVGLAAMSVFLTTTYLISGHTALATIWLAVACLNALLAIRR